MANLTQDQINSWLTAGKEAWALPANSVMQLLGEGNSWAYRDGDPYANLQLAGGASWNPSGAGSGITRYRAGERKVLTPATKGDAENAAVYGDPFQQDTYEISGDISNLLGRPASGLHADVQYTQQGDTLVPTKAPEMWDWNANHRADNMSLLTSAALMAPAVAGFSGVGAGASAPGATAIDGIATGVTTGAEAAAQGGSLMSTLAPYDAGAQLVGQGLGAFAPAATGGTGAAATLATLAGGPVTASKLVGGLGAAGQLLSGIRGIQQAGNVADTAAQSNATGPYRAGWASMLNDLLTGKTSMSDTPGFKAGQDAITTSQAAKGYLNSGNMMAALQNYGGTQFQNYASLLGNLAGQQSPAAIQGQSSAAGAEQSAINNTLTGVSGLLKAGGY